MAKARITQEELVEKQNEPIIPDAVKQALDQLQQNQVLLQQQNAELQAKLKEKDSAKEDAAEQARMDKLRADSDLKKLMSESSDDKDALNGMTNVELLSVIAEAMESGVNAKLESVVQEHVKQFGAEITGIKSSIDNVKNVVLQQNAFGEVKQMEVKYADFNALKPQINQALSIYPGLALEDAYILVKGKVAASVPADKHTFSERPDASLTRGSQIDEPENNVSSPRRPANEEQRTSNRGINGFRSALDAAVDKVMQKRKS